jgi:hypothetical protein
MVKPSLLDAAAHLLDVEDFLIVFITSVPTSTTASSAPGTAAAASAAAAASYLPFVLVLV